MNLFLDRKQYTLYGITGQISDSSGNFLFVTLEHAYQQLDGSFLPKVAPGAYTCVRHPPQRLHYETFMLQNVPPFMGAPVDGILIHVGNYNGDSIGCILLGQALGTGMIEDSQKAFDAFMELQNGCENFTLIVA